MKRKGFTLMEVLICMGIIGILTGIFMRLITGAMPDQDKLGFVRAYLTTKTIVADMISDPSLYPDEYGMTNYGFANTTAPVYGRYAGFASGADKFPNIFADKLGLPTGGGYSNRDGINYGISGFVITITNNAGTTLGTFTVGNDGGVTCSSTLGYCSDITNLRKSLD